MAKIAVVSDQFSLPGFELPARPLRRMRASHAAVPRHGLFFGVLPASDDRPRIEAAVAPLRRRFGATKPEVEAARLHITCCDLGGFAEEPPLALTDAAIVIAIAASLVLPSFEIVFERVMRFKGNRAVVLLERAGVTPLTVFRDALDQALIRARVPTNLVSTPHMTLGYGGDAVLETLAEPIRWQAVDFVLVDSHVHRHLHVHRGRWPLVVQR